MLISHSPRSTLHVSRQDIRNVIRRWKIHTLHHIFNNPLIFITTHSALRQYTSSTPLLSYKLANRINTAGRPGKIQFVKRFVNEDHTGQINGRVHVFQHVLLLSPSHRHKMKNSTPKRCVRHIDDILYCIITFGFGKCEDFQLFFIRRAIIKNTTR